MLISKFFFKNAFWKIHKPISSIRKCPFHSIFSQNVANLKVKNCNSSCLNIFSPLPPICISFLNGLIFRKFFFLRSSYCWFLTALNMVRFTTFSLSCMFQIFFRSLPHLLLIWNYRFQISFCLILHCQSFLWLFHRWLHAYKNLFQSQVDQYLIVILCFVLGSPRWCVPCLLFTEKGVCGILFLRHPIS